MKINNSPVTQKKNKKTLIIVASAALILALIGGAAYAWYQSHSDNTPSSDQTGETNYNTPTDKEVEEGQSSKKDAYNNAGDNTSDTSNGAVSSKTTVEVGVSYADLYDNNLEVHAFTSSVNEGTGTCTATVTKGDDIITKTVDAFIDVSTTQCSPVYIEQSILSPGTWSVVVAFSSPNAQGTSDPVSVTIP